MRFQALLTITILCSPFAAYANDERPLTGYVEVDSGLADVVQPTNHTSNILFLNRCQGGCTINPGFNDSRTNRSSIVDGTSQVSEFAHGDVTWNAVVDCVKGQYEPFDIVVTDVDPGNVPHFEAIVAGRPQDIGAGNGTGGVAPFSCGIINNAITFSFANIYGSAQQICEVVAQESAHAFGLDHEYLCEDPMTYLNGCGNKSFQDIDAQCGEFSARQCSCGGSTQNSYAEILNHFGPGVPTPPEVSILKPEDGAKVEPGFAIEADATDNRQVARVELYINNQFIFETSTKPYVFNAPPELSGGILQIEVRAYDDKGEMAKDDIQVTQGAPCTDDSCADGEVCVAGRCVQGPTQPGGLGQVCTNNEECVSGQCGQDSAGNRYCAEPCEDGGCPSGFKCLGAGSSGAVCWPGEESKGCNAAGGTPGTPLAVAFVLAMMMLVRRRRGF